MNRPWHSFSPADLTCCTKMRPAHNVTHDSHGCVSSALVSAVSFLKWLHSDQTPLKSFPVRKRCNATSVLQAGGQIMLPIALLTWGKAASAGKFLERCFPTAIPTYPRTLGICSKRFTHGLGAGLRCVATSSSACS